MNSSLSVVLAGLVVVGCCKSPDPSSTVGTGSGSGASERSEVVVQNADPAIEAVIRKAYNAVLVGDNATVLGCCHPELSKFKGSFDSGYSPGRAGSLGELSNWAANVKGGDKLAISNLRVEVVRQEGERAIAWA